MRPLVVAALAAAACASQTPTVATTSEPRVEVKRAVGKNVPKEPRLGWVTWDDDTLVACNRRIDDEGRSAGVLGPCKRVGADGVLHTIVSWTNFERPDASLADAGPQPICSLELQPTRAPDTQPATVMLVQPSGTVELEAWKPESGLTADEYRVEASFSPDGKWMALVHLAIGLGEGQRTVEIAGVRRVPRPVCR